MTFLSIKKLLTRSNNIINGIFHAGKNYLISKRQNTLN